MYVYLLYRTSLKKANISIDEIPNNLREVISKKEVAVHLSASDDSIFNYIKKNN